MENTLFRRSVKEDIPYINSLFIQMVKTVNARMLNEGIEPYTDLENGFEENYLDRFYVDDNNLIFVAESNGDVIGFLSINNHRENGYIYLDDFCVSEECRGQGIGCALIQMAFAFAEEQQINQILTHVESANKESIEFYKNRGFQLIEAQGHRLLIRKEVN